MYRLTSEMLLNHPFVEGLDNDDAAEELEVLAYSNEIESTVLVCESDDEWGDASEEDPFSYWSEEDAESMDDELLYNVAEEKESEGVKLEGVMGSSTDTGFDQSNEMPKQIPSQSLSKRRQHYPVSLTIPAGI